MQQNTGTFFLLRPVSFTFSLGVQRTLFVRSLPTDFVFAVTALDIIFFLSPISWTLLFRKPSHAVSMISCWESVCGVAIFGLAWHSGVTRGPPVCCEESDGDKRLWNLVSHGRVRNLGVVIMKIATRMRACFVTPSAEVRFTFPFL